MTTLKKSPKVLASVVPVAPKYILRKDAFKYTGMEEKLFNKAAIEFGLSVYARGPKKVWYKVAELDALMESFKIIDSRIVSV